MLVFERFAGGLYLTQTDIANPAAARLGFLFQNAQRSDPTFELTAASFADPALQGFLAFFLPSGTRDWSAFATSVRNGFNSVQGSQFAWFSGPDSVLQIATAIIVSGQGTSNPTVSQSASFVNRNSTVQIVPSFFPVQIVWDDANNQFTFSNPNAGTSSAPVRLIFQPVSGGSLSFPSVSSLLVLPLTDNGAGTINGAYQFATTDLDGFEAGLMYFAPPETVGENLTALRYPVLRAPGGGAIALNFSFWLDVLNPADPDRTYFLATDPTLGATFAAATGQVFALGTTQTGPVQNLSRFVFSNRPQQNVTDQSFFYLALAGQFSLSIDNGGTTITALAPVLSSAALLCGSAGTEFFTASVAAGSADTLTFIPGQPAFAPGTPGSLLNSSGGNITTSWAQFATRTGNYVSQPEQSPLYQQNPTSRISLSPSGDSGNAAHILDFLPLAAWVPNSNNGPVSAPLVPLAPYAGIPASTDLTPFRAMESTAINPTRRNAFSAATQVASRQLFSTSATTTAPIPSTFAMTPQGLLAGLTSDTPPLWTATQIATSGSGTLQITRMGTEIRAVLQQNQIFAVISTLTGPQSQTLFSFAGQDQTIDISDWFFSLAPVPPLDPDGNPPILIFKFYNGQSIQDLASDASLWSEPDAFNNGSYTAAQAQAYIEDTIAKAKDSVDADPDSLLANFYEVVTDPNFEGVLALNCNLQLNALPPAIQAVMGGMTKKYADGQTVSNLAAFRAHHVGIQINDTDPKASQPTLSQSSLFALVDYEKPEPPAAAKPAALGISLVPLGFEVEYLRALFTNSELRSFACKLNLTINKLFDTAVVLDSGKTSGAPPAADEDSVISIYGSYQNHSGDGSEGKGVYSFVAGPFEFTFGENQYLDTIALEKLQFSFSQSGDSSVGVEGTTKIDSRFSIWGSISFKKLDVLDIFSIEKLSFADLGIGVSFDLQLSPPETSNLALKFSPGDLRLDLAQTQPREDDTSLMKLLPFRLRSFLYSETADETVESLDFFSLSAVPGLSSVSDTFNYALIFDLDLGSAGALVGSLAAFKFSFLVGWLSGDKGGVAFGVQMPEADGKLEIRIQGIIDLIIEKFVLQYINPKDGGQQMLVIGMHSMSIEILGQRMPPQGNLDFALFKPLNGDAQIGWIVGYNNEDGQNDNGNGGDGGGGGEVALMAAEPNDDGNGVLDIKFLGLGQRVGPDPASPPTTFAEFLKFMTDDFWAAFDTKEYDKVYHPDGKWLIVTDLKILRIVQVGVIFYDVTPFYSLTLNVEKLFNFEITYTKVSDSIGLFYANLSLPDSLRTFQVGAASLTLPAIGVSVYTNGNWKVDVGFPVGDDWSRSFQVQCMAGPVPVTGAGGFYIASLSSATDDIFIKQYPSILAFGFAARLGVGKDFTAGPLKAGVSVTFFGIIEGAAGYLVSGSTDIFHEPDALLLKGQFGIIGELYGSLDFVIIKASVNVRLSASIGIVLHLEKNVPGFDGSILLYIEASVSVSVSVSIDLFLFSITISFSFNASFRFEWQLLGSSGKAQFLTAVPHAHRLLSLAAPVNVPLCPGFNPAMPLWFLPEITVVFPDATTAGSPCLVVSLGIEFDPAPTASPTYAQFKPFEALATQLATWGLTNALGLPAYNSPVKQSDISTLDQDPAALIGFITYDLLLAQVAVFNKTSAFVLNGTAGAQYHASVFPMPPFLQLATAGRLASDGKPADLRYQFSANNVVPQTYIAEIDEYFNQLFVNQTQGGTNLTGALDTATVPLSSQTFLEYFNGLIRGAVHQLLQTMQNKSLDSANLDQVFIQSVGSGDFAALAGQMSGMFRGGARLPYTAGLTVPTGPAPAGTNPLYSLLWQQFPAGNFNTSTPQYSVALTNPDTTQTWLTTSVNYTLAKAAVDPYAGIMPTSVTLPGAPVLIPFTGTGPQAFSFTTQSTWTQPASVVTSLRALPPSLLQLTAAESPAVKMVVESRQAGSAYMADGTALPVANLTWATIIPLVVSQVPATAGGASAQKFIPNVYAVTGASQAAQQTLQDILEVLKSSNPIASIQVLYQTSAGSAGLTSAAINPADVFLLRTNTTTISAPPVQLFSATLAAPPVPTVSVGAQIDEPGAFLQILEQASITNAFGYYLHYKDAAGNDLPSALFTSGPAPLTVLITYKPDDSANTQASPSLVQSYFNAISLASTDTSLVYYAVTTDPALNLQYSCVASGSVGVELTRQLNSTMLTVPASAARGALAANAVHSKASFISAAVSAGISDEASLRVALSAAGANVAQVNLLYSLLTYQTQAAAGMFIESNLSAPIQPQAPSGASDSAPRDYRAFVPLYTLATSNQMLPTGVPPDRYASLTGTCGISFYLNDAFGNQLPGQLPFSHKNLYFDPIISIDRWQGVVPSFDFGTGQANTVTVYLNPSQQAFADMNAVEAQAALSGYYTIADQILGMGVSFYVESNLSLTTDGTFVSVNLTAAQNTQVQTLVNQILTYLQGVASGGAPAWNVQPVTLRVVLPATADALPPAFEVTVLFGIQRDMALIDPSLVDPLNGLIFPSAQNVNTTVAPSPASAGATLPAFAANFALAFPSLLLTVGLNGAAQPAPSTSSAAIRRRALRASGVPTDAAAPSASAGARSLWAVQQSLLNVTINSATGLPLYTSPKPLSNALQSGVVPMPALPSGLPQLPQTRTFTDVDLDSFNSSFFAAVDKTLSAGSAAAMFQANRAAYNGIAIGREQLAVGYSDNEVEWLFPAGAPFTGSDDQLTAARETFEQQMRAALMTAYSVDTILQFPVQWNSTLPAGAAGQISLYGQVQPLGMLSGSAGFSSAEIDIPEHGGPGLLTFLYSAPDIAETAQISVDLQLNVTHIQVFTEPPSATPPDEARPSLWLQLIPGADGSPTSTHIGPAGTPTVVPLVFRQYPTPPTIISQSGQAPGDSTGTKQCNLHNVLSQSAAWHYTLNYQAQITPHDRLLAYVTYNTVTSNGSAVANAAFGAPVQYTLFQALARFNAAWAVLQPIIVDPTNTNFAATAGAFAQLVSDVVNNSDWNPVPGFSLQAGKQTVTDQYAVTDQPVQQSTSRLITLTWPQIESSFPAATISVQAIAPDGNPYPGQIAGTVTNGITDSYVPTTPLSGDWVSHQIEIDCLNVLSAENARPAVQIERNLIVLPGTQNTSWTVLSEFIYMTAMVSASQPVTPFVDNSIPINVAQLPNQGANARCPASPSSLCQRVYTILNDLLTDPGQLTARKGASDGSAIYRVKMGCGFAWPITAATGTAPGLDPITPVVPVVLARSFDIDVSVPDQMETFASSFANAISSWAGANTVLFGAMAQPAGGQLIFDVTLFAQLSGNNRPLLRLRNLQLALTDVETTSR